MIIISNAQRDSLVRILEQLNTLLPSSPRNSEVLRRANNLRRALESRPKLDREEFSKELQQKIRQNK